MHAFFWIYFSLSCDVRSVGGDVPVDYGGACGDFVNLKRMCRLGLLEVLIRIEVCVHAFIGMGVCAYI